MLLLNCDKISERFINQGNIKEVMEIAYLGPKGTFSYVAAKEYVQEQSIEAVLRPYKTIDSALDALLAGEVARAIVPESNTRLGLITDSCRVRELDELVTIDEVEVSVEMALGGFGDGGNIGVVYSKDRALEQCTNYLERLFGVERRDLAVSDYVKLLASQGKVELMDSTTAGMMEIMLAGSENAAAIGPHGAFELYGLQVYNSNVHDDPDAKTKFAVVEKKIK